MCFALAFAGCAVGPDYKRPPADAPTSYRGETGAAANSFADLPWWVVFHDATLQGLIRTALANNYDVRLAVARVEQARAIDAEARAQFFPQFNYALLAGGAKNVANDSPSPTGIQGKAFAADANVSWEIDLWGRIRRLNESARAQFLSSQEARRDVTISLISQVAQDYFQLLALDKELDIARQSVSAFGESLKIFNERLHGGVGSRLETSSAVALMEAASATIPGLEEQIALQENQLSVLLGQNPGPIARGSTPYGDEMPPEIPAGVPSALLERRPDIRESEQQLRSANALVGASEANLFPQLDLTALFGRVSPQLSTFASGGEAAWSIGAGLTGPLFHGGQLRAQYAQARSVRDQAVLQYRAVVLNALREVSDALITGEKEAGAQDRQGRAVAAYKEAVKISTERYRLGSVDYYVVLQEQQLLFPAENTLVELQIGRLLAVVQLYRALGGGWQIDVAGNSP
jgi:multidrug efflux system outer membrane protein